LGDTGAAMVRAARAAGATEVLEGALYRAPDGQFRLDLRRVDANAGAVRGAYAITGVHLFGVVDSATSALARDFNVQPTRLRVSDVSTTSLVAHRFYEEGLRLYYQGNARGALRLFEASVAEDSLFAMASYYVAMCNLALSDEASAVKALQRATASGRRATEREGLLIRTHLAFLAGEPAAVAIAESLAARYPTEPDGHLLVGHSRNWRGDYFEAIPRFRRVLQMDSLAFRGEAVRCRACEAVGSLAATYAAIDSFAAAERLARDMIRRGHGPRGWAMSLAGIFERQANVDSALVAFSRISPQTLGIDGAMVFRANLAIRSGNFEEADRILNDVLRDGMADLRGGALWWLSVSLRYQGRLAEALSVARQIRHLSPVQEWFVVTSAALIEAQVLFELGRRAEAAALFDSIGRGIDPAKPARTARHRTWMLSHVATSRAAAGDTAELEMLADSMELEGQKSLYGRDPRLHHHVRGLLWRARGRPTDAEAAFRRALYSPTSGYTRTNLELGRLLLEQRHPREAITMLSPALRGPLDASNLYVTHTEIHELLARAFDDVGQADSALTHYRWIEQAWRKSDPAFHARREAARRRVAELDAQRETGGARS
ncbi:MAG: tetratricopeptide repeat protein, partial [Gemmatimonadota bacterium]|nr:tetratricopeptide repeat protein [Gemmatimonadota bacterium]